MTDWAGTGFVFVYGNLPKTLIPPWTRILCVQLCSGTERSAQRPDQAWFKWARDTGYTVAAWHWCTGENPEAEAQYHATTTYDHGIQILIANIEAGYDASGNSNDANFKKPGRYLSALHWDGPLGVTTTPLFGSDMTGWRDAGAVYMPQSFPTATEGGYDLLTVVDHGEAWGWPRGQIRPLVQTYAGNQGVWPDAIQQNQQAAELGVGVIPYLLEDALAAAQPCLDQLRNAIERPTSSGGGGGQPVAPTEPDWWEKGYPGGPMVKVVGFPRPLYPPDAKGYRPSVDGPDVIAYKRTVSRAGRWPWGGFDDTYSNGFSHGKSGNVKDTGVAGIQRQQHLDATGYIGQKTFNTLRSIRIPEGLPHAGEPAMDAYAVELINEAFHQYQGAEPPPPITDTVRQLALEAAIRELGQVESPSGSNLNKYGKWYGMDGQPWCAMFVTWAYEQTGSPSFAKGSTYSYCPYVVADARANNNGLQTTDDPIPGDLVVYDWSYDTIYDHIGLFEQWTGGGTFDAIEGNTSTSNNSNGGQVMRRNRSKSGQGTVFVRVREP